MKLNIGCQGNLGWKEIPQLIVNEPDNNDEEINSNVNDDDDLSRADL